ncbi:hypothetical protein, partial [Brevibacterium metallidurans]|uniref:hypothetical protein n=1 Tax=Brevibacterium metallidurans TaxID=1482676 RepID=UPI0030D8095D
RPCTTNWTASALNSGVNVLRFVDMIPCRAFLVTTVYEKCHTPWILKRAQILAVVDMQRDLFQPKNDTQTSMVLMRRLDAGEVADAEDSGLDYPVFMAVAEKIGHDKRGNVIYRRTPEGEDALVKRIETIFEIDQETGAEVVRQIEVTERQVDDELSEVADAYRRWLEAQL